VTVDTTHKDHLDFWGNGSTTHFPFPWILDDEEDSLHVYFLPNDSAAGQKLVQGVDYKIMGSPETGEGEILYPLAEDAQALAMNERLYIIPELSISQKNSWRYSGVTDLSLIEQADDRLTRICQQLRGEIQRCVRMDPRDGQDPSEFIEKIKSVPQKANLAITQIKELHEQVQSTTQKSVSQIESLTSATDAKAKQARSQIDERATQSLSQIEQLTQGAQVEAQLIQAQLEKKAQDSVKQIDELAKTTKDTAQKAHTQLDASAAQSIQQIDQLTQNAKAQAQYAQADIETQAEQSITRIQQEGQKNISQMANSMATVQETVRNSKNDIQKTAQATEQKCSAIQDTIQKLTQTTSNAEKKANDATKESASAIEQARQALHLVHGVESAGLGLLYDGVRKLLDAPQSSAKERQWAVESIDALPLASLSTVTIAGAPRVELLLTGALYGMDPALSYGQENTLPQDCYGILRINDTELYASFLEQKNGKEIRTRILLHPVYSSAAQVTGIQAGDTVNCAICTRRASHALRGPVLRERQFFTNSLQKLCACPSPLSSLPVAPHWTTLSAGASQDGASSVKFSSTKPAHALFTGLDLSRSYLVEAQVSLSAGSLAFTAESTDPANACSAFCSATHGTGVLSCMLPAGRTQSSCGFVTGTQGATGRCTLTRITEVRPHDLCPSLNSFCIGTFSFSSHWSQDASGALSCKKCGYESLRIAKPLRPLTPGRRYLFEVVLTGTDCRAALTLSTPRQLTKLSAKPTRLSLSVIWSEKTQVTLTTVKGSAQLLECHIWEFPSSADPILGRLACAPVLSGCLESNSLGAVQDTQNARLHPCVSLADDAPSAEPPCVSVQAPAGEQSIAQRVSSSALSGSSILAFSFDAAHEILQCNLTAAAAFCGFSSAQAALDSGVLVVEYSRRAKGFSPVHPAQYPMLLPGAFVLLIQPQKLTHALLSELFDVALPQQSARFSSGVQYVLSAHFSPASLDWSAEHGSFGEVTYTPSAQSNDFMPVLALWPYLSLCDGEYLMVCMYEEYFDSNHGSLNVSDSSGTGFCLHGEKLRRSGAFALPLGIQELK